MCFSTSPNLWWWVAQVGVTVRWLGVQRGSEVRSQKFSRQLKPMVLVGPNRSYFEVIRGPEIRSFRTSSNLWFWMALMGVSLSWLGVQKQEVFAQAQKVALGGPNQCYFEVIMGSDIRSFRASPNLWFLGGPNGCVFAVVRGSDFRTIPSLWFWVAQIGVTLRWLGVQKSEVFAQLQAFGFGWPKSVLLWGRWGVKVGYGRIREAR